MTRPRILLCDDHALLLDGYTRLLEDQFNVVGAARDGRQLLELAVALKPDLILLDISMPLLNGIDAARRLSGLIPRTRILMVSMHGDPDYVAESFRAGASGFVLKAGAADELRLAIRQVLAGHRYVTPLIPGQSLSGLLESEGRDPVAWQLTLRQREVLQLVAEGRTASEIAELLKISPKTVEFHKSRIMHQLGVRSVADLTRYAVRHGMLV
jgi:DNA-binding NarL/FixJ family response regulator